MSEQPAPYGSGAGTTPGSPPASTLKRIRIPHLQAMKERGERWAMLTAYDQYSAEIFDEARHSRSPDWRFGWQQRLRIRDDGACHG